METLLPFLVVGISVGAVYALSGVGLVVLYRASGVVNFAYGALGGLAAMVCWQIIDMEYADWMGWVAGVFVLRKLWPAVLRSRRKSALETTDGAVSG